MSKKAKETKAPQASPATGTQAIRVEGWAMVHVLRDERGVVEATYATSVLFLLMGPDMVVRGAVGLAGPVIGPTLLDPEGAVHAPDGSTYPDLESFEAVARGSLH